jgi:hypothetical protein
MDRRVIPVLSRDNVEMAADLIASTLKMKVGSGVTGQGARVRKGPSKS